MHLHLQGSIGGLGIRIPFCSLGSRDLQGPRWITRACQEEARHTLRVSINIMLLPCGRHFRHFWRAKNPAYQQFNSRKEKPSQERPTLWTVHLWTLVERMHRVCVTQSNRIPLWKSSRKVLKVKINDYPRDVTATLCEIQFKQTKHCHVHLGQENRMDA